MSGLRIHHPTLRSCQLIVDHPGNAQGRRPKPYYIDIDHEGDALVSETVWMRLQEARASGLSEHAFILMNAVMSPPTLRIDPFGKAAEEKRTFRQIRNVAQEFAPNGVVPRITQKDK